MSFEAVFISRSTARAFYPGEERKFLSYFCFGYRKVKSSPAGNQQRESLNDCRQIRAYCAIMRAVFAFLASWILKLKANWSADALQIQLKIHKSIGNGNYGEICGGDVRNERSMKIRWNCVRSSLHEAKPTVNGIIIRFKFLRWTAPRSNSFSEY